jgi:hypothetical protein
MLNRATITAVSLLAAGLLLTACSSSGSSNTTSNANANATAAVGANATKTATDAGSAYTTIHAAVPSSKLSLTVTEANDGNHLLGRPHQYTSAVKFTDSRVSKSDTGGLLHARVRTPSSRSSR